VISTSSGEVTALIVVGPVVIGGSCGGVKGSFALMDIDACALLRLRFAMMVVGGDGIELLLQEGAGVVGYEQIKNYMRRPTRTLLYLSLAIARSVRCQGSAALEMGEMYDCEI
jgi:hypothetical protein